MCGDSTKSRDVRALMGGKATSVVFTSPPYDKQRTYDGPMHNWEEMMVAAFEHQCFTPDVQALVNVGSYHQKNECVQYWRPWVEQMRQRRWLFHAEYIWKKSTGLPHAIRTRLTPMHEYVLHFTKKPRQCIACVPTKRRGENVVNSLSRQRKKSGEKAKPSGKWNSIGPLRLHGSVIETSVLHPSESTSHPAQFPSALPRVFFRSFATENANIYDPFCGSGTTIVACQEEGLTGFGMEISATYCAMAIARWNTLYPQQVARLAYD